MLWIKGHLVTVSLGLRSMHVRVGRRVEKSVVTETWLVRVHAPDSASFVKPPPAARVNSRTIPIHRTPK